MFGEVWTGGAGARVFLSVSPCRRLDADLSRVLLLPVLREQRVGDDRLAVPLLRGQHRRLERPGCHHRGALPHGQKVLRTILLLVSTLYPRDVSGGSCIFLFILLSLVLQGCIILGQDRHLQA